MTSPSEAQYDVFLSLGGNDRDQGRSLASRLRESGLRVFIDEDNIGCFGGITTQIEQALRSSKTFVVYYSRTYPERPSCQIELTAAFLAGQAEGDPTRRILVINPERDEDHLLPAELADARYVPASLALSEQVRLIRERVAAIDGVIGEVNFRRRPPRYYGRLPGTPGFVGRYREQWAIHSALFAPDLPLSQEGTNGPVACVAGLPGVGKTSLVAAYAWNFGAAFTGGVYWTRLAGRGDQSLASYDTQLLEVARFLGVEIEPGDRYRVRGAVSTHLAAQEGSTLWVVDNVPGDLDLSTIHDLVLPAGPRVRTILISDQKRLATVVPLLTIGGLDPYDAAALLDQMRPASGVDERRARDRITTLVGGHAGALTDIGRAIRDGHGIISYEQFLARLGCGNAAITIDEVLHSVIAGLTEPRSTDAVRLELG